MLTNRVVANEGTAIVALRLQARLRVDDVYRVERRDPASDALIARPSLRDEAGAGEEGRA